VRQQKILVVVVGAALAVGGACGRERGAGAPPDAGSPAPSFALSGYVVGLRGGAVTLENGADRTVVAADGAFTFAARLPDGVAYAVTTLASPPGQRCVVAHGAGVVAGADVVDVAVTCLSTDATLRSLSIAPGAIGPAFAPDVTSYTAPTFPSYLPAVTLRAVPSDAAAVVHVGDADVAPGAPVDVALGPGPAVIAVTVTAASGDALTYRIAVQRTPVVHLKASNTGAYDNFGEGLAISGDTLAVGASDESSAAPGVGADQTNDDARYAGAVYVFTEAAGTWSQQAYIKASNPGARDQFGTAVALDGDTLVVGAPGESSSARGSDGDQSDDSASFAGAVYVFERRAGIWAQTAYLKASNAGASDAFGASVAVSGDTLVVGAPGEASGGADPGDDSAPGAGAAYVLQRKDGAWTETAYLKASSPDAGDGFGTSVALAGDTIAVGAPVEASAARGIDGDATSNAAPYAGAAYVFARAGGAWSPLAYLKASNSRTNVAFGVSVAASGDTILVGAYDEPFSSTGVDGDQSARDSNIAWPGAAYVFVRRGATFVQQAYLKAFGTCESFGLGVALDGDTALVGSQCGLAYGYVRSGETWAEGPLFNLRADRISLGPGVAVGGGRFVFQSNDNSAATGVDPPPTTALASFSGTVYVLE